MAERTIQIKATPDKKITAYWVAVDATPVPLMNDEGSVTFDAGESAVLVWWMTGSPGGLLALAGKESAGQVLVESKSAIPKGETVHAGFKRFNPGKP